MDLPSFSFDSNSSSSSSSSSSSAMKPLSSPTAFHLPHTKLQPQFQLLIFTQIHKALYALSLSLSQRVPTADLPTNPHLSLSLSLSESLVSLFFRSRTQSEDGSNFFLEISSCIERARRKSASFGANPSYPQNGELHLNCWGGERGKNRERQKKKGDNVV
jgi:hypothetical protein